MKIAARDTFRILPSCTSCEACVETCPTGSVVFAVTQYAIDTDTCHACGVCARICPVDAIIPATIQPIDLGRTLPESADAAESEEEL